MNTNPYALLLDAENLYVHLSKTMGYQVAGDTLLTMTDRIAEDLRERFGGRAAIQRAYADFEQLRNVQGRLSIAGIDPVNVAGRGHKNAADMRLTVDAMELIYCRPDIQDYVIGSGDRDYIPLIQHAHRKGCDVWIIAFADSLSNDLVDLVPNDHVLDAAAYAPEVVGETERPGVTPLKAAPRRDASVAAFAQRAMTEILTLQREKGYEDIGLSAVRRAIEEVDGACPIAFSDAIQHLTDRDAVTIEQQTMPSGQPCKVARINWDNDFVRETKHALAHQKSQAAE